MASDLDRGAALLAERRHVAVPHQAVPPAHEQPSEPAQQPQRNRDSEPMLQVVHGLKRVVWVAYELQRSAQNQVQALVKPPYEGGSSLHTLECFKLSQGVQFQVLYDRTALVHPQQREATSRLVSRGEEARVLPAAPTKLLLVDQEVALVPLTTADHGNENSMESALVIRGSAMLVGLQRIFAELWRGASPLNSGFEGTAKSERVPQPTDEDRWILSLLASGATDDGIGRSMGFSARTAHRRVRELVARLGVETRFQAGMKAVKLGWL